MSTPSVRPFLSATRDFAAGTDDPRRFLERCLSTLAVVEPEILAFVNLNLAGARAAADDATRRWRAGAPRSSIDGMPVGIKDIIETVDMPTENGSPLFRAWRSGRDAASVAALREAGAVIVGKTVTTEFAATEPRETRNPWDVRRTPGGSSSGSAAAVAAGILPAALGTQVIGSILRPASFCGCVGFKPSVGGINRGGSHDNLSQSCDGVLAATLADAWAVAREISARAGGDPGFPGLTGPLALPAPQRPAAVAFLETAGWERATAEARTQLAAVRAALATAGITILDRHTSATVAAVEAALLPAMPLSRSINAWESRWPLNTYARDRDRDGLSRAMQDRLAQAERMTLEEYGALLAERQHVRDTFAGLTAGCDVAITLAATGPAPIGLGDTGDPIFVVPSSLLGVPAVSLPVLRAEDLPLGLQLLGAAGADAALVAVAGWIRDRLAEAGPS